METEQHYLRVGVFAVLLAVALAAFAMWIASDGLGNIQPYRIYFEESVSGLSQGSPVKYRGVTVGQVSAITIDKKDPRYIRVDVAINDSTPVKVGTVAGLKLQGITGAVFIELSGSRTDAQDLVEAQPDVRVPIIPSTESSIATIMNQLPQITEKLGRFADQLSKLSSDENIEKFNATLENLSLMSADMRGVLRDTKGDIVESTENLNGTMSNLRRASRDISSVTDRIEDDPSSLIFPPEEQGIPAP